MSIWRDSTRMLGGDDRPPFEGAYIYIFTLILGYMVADLTSLYIRPDLLPQTTPTPRPYSPPPDKVGTRADYDPILQRHLFSDTGEDPEALTASPEEASPEAEGPAVLSQLPLKLEGTIVHANPRRSVATIMIQAKNETQAFMVDDKIEGMANITLIERRRVTFRNLQNSRLEYIEIPKDTAITFGLKDDSTQSKSSDIAKESEFEYSVRRDDLNKYIQDLPNVLNQAAAVPNIIPGSGGRIEGFRFVKIQEGSVIEKLGLKVGDVIKGVNGVPVNSPAKAMEMYNALLNESMVKITVNRDGRDETLVYTVK